MGRDVYLDINHSLISGIFILLPFCIYDLHAGQLVFVWGQK